jgi:hypothetical protein
MPIMSIPRLVIGIVICVVVLAVLGIREIIRED